MDVTNIAVIGVILAQTAAAAVDNSPLAVLVTSITTLIVSAAAMLRSHKAAVHSTEIVRERKEFKKNQEDGMAPNYGRDIGMLLEACRGLADRLNDLVRAVETQERSFESHTRMDESMWREVNANIVRLVTSADQTRAACDTNAKSVARLSDAVMALAMKTKEKDSG